jgi:hypothetical protein
MKRARPFGSETGTAGEIAEMRERQAQPIEHPRGRMRPRRVDPNNLPSMGDYGIRPAPSRVSSPVPDGWTTGDDAG